MNSEVTPGRSTPQTTTKTIINVKYSTKVETKNPDSLDNETEHIKKHQQTVRFSQNTKQVYHSTLAPDTSANANRQKYVRSQTSAHTVSPENLNTQVHVCMFFN